MSPRGNGTGRTLARGSAWVAAGQAVSAVAGLVGSVTAARVLSPSDFGLMGLSLLAIATLNALSQTGFERALVQRREVEGLLDVAWTAQVLRGGFLAIVVMGAAWPLSLFYHEPRLLPIFFVMSGSMLAQGFRSVATIFFNRALDFRALFVVDALRALANLIVLVTLVLLFRNVWALVIGYVAGAMVELVISYVVHPHRPRFDFKLRKASELMVFGKWITGMSVLGLIVTRGDDMFISKYLGVTALGFYTMAYELSNLPATRITHVLGRVSFPTYSRLNDVGDRAQMRQAFNNVMKATLLISGPVSVLILLGVDGAVQHVIGAKWEPIVPLVKILAIAGFVRSVAALATGLFHAAGRPALDFWMNVPRFVLLVALIWPACALGGLAGASYLVLIAVSSCLPTWLYGTRAILGVSFMDLVRENALAVVSSAALALWLWAVQTVLSSGTLMLFLGDVGLALALWLGTLWVLGKVTPLRLFAEVTRLTRALRRTSSEAG